MILCMANLRFRVQWKVWHYRGRVLIATKLRQIVAHCLREQWGGFTEKGINTTGHSFKYGTNTVFRNVRFMQQRPEQWKTMTRKKKSLPGYLEYFSITFLAQQGRTETQQIVCCLIVSWLSLENANRTRLQKLVQEALTGYQALSSIQQMVNDF